MTARQHVMVSRARRGKGPATKKAHRRMAMRAQAVLQQERERRIDAALQHRSSGQS